MKLTSAMRHQIVEAVLEDVPQVDYQQQAEQAVQAYVIAKAPPAVQALYNDSALRQYLAVNHVHFPGSLQSRYVIGAIAHRELSGEIVQSLEQLNAQNSAQRNNRIALRDKVSGLLAGCTTVAMAHKLLPEFVKYLPDDTKRGTITNLPQLTNVIADLSKAGWPKEKK